LGEVWPVRLRYTRRAARQLDAVLAYITERSPEGAQHVMDRLEAAIDLVRDHPRSGALTGKRDFRRIVANPYPYLIFYRATADEIVIHGIRHAARRPRG
jgi:addiction module RelE/StbE family toxin